MTSNGYIPEIISDVRSRQSIPCSIVLYKSEISALIGFGSVLIVSRNVPAIIIGMPGLIYFTHVATFANNRFLIKAYF
jgi:hypothetical protein